MAYRVYIKNDYKPEIVWSRQPPRRRRPGYIYVLLAIPVLSAFIWFAGPDASFTKNEVATEGAGPFTSAVTPFAEEISVESVIAGANFIQSATTGTPDISAHTQPGSSTDREDDWLGIKVKPGDSMAQIFKRRGLSPRDLHEILNAHELATALKHLLPGQTIYLQTDGDRLLALKFDLDLTQTLLVRKQDGVFTSEIITVELETRVEQAQGIINESLFLAAQAAGLPDKIIMQLIDIYGWDIDFRLDIRQGDSFKVIYEERYKNRDKVAVGPVLAAEFINRDRIIRTARYERDGGGFDYYTEDGVNMRKAFLRNPLNFSRISSHFNLKRKHPVLNRIRAHKGVDYAAASGTPIKATGDGTIQHIGNKGGYGKTIIVQHGGKYSTLYAHMSRYRKGLKRGHAVKQGQVIGYVGRSGLATGPHLHYEFRVNGRHHNPLTVELPAAENVPLADMGGFKIQSAHLFALLDTSDPRLLAQYEPGNGL